MWRRIGFLIGESCLMVFECLWKWFCWRRWVWVFLVLLGFWIGLRGLIVLFWFWRGLSWCKIFLILLWKGEFCKRSWFVVFFGRCWRLCGIVIIVGCFIVILRMKIFLLILIVVSLSLLILGWGCCLRILFIWILMGFECIVF